MTKPPAHKRAFAPHFRRHASGCCSQPAAQRVREATAEIQEVAKRDPLPGASGAVLFLDKVSPALEQVDNSSSVIGTAISHAIDACVKIIAAVEDRARHDGELASEVQQRIDWSRAKTD